MSAKDESVKTLLTIGRELEIIYHGGSQPGSLRRVVPVAFDEKYLRARDVTGGQRVKQFLLDRVEIPSQDSSAVNYEPELRRELPEPASVQEAVLPYMTALEEQGWHVHLDDSEVELYSCLKNGNLRKTPTISLSFEPEIHEYYWDEGKDEEVMDTRPSKRPWHVGKNSFSKLSKALTKFLLLAEEQVKWIHNS